MAFTFKEGSWFQEKASGDQPLLSLRVHPKHGEGILAQELKVLGLQDPTKVLTSKLLFGENSEHRLQGGFHAYGRGDYQVGKSCRRGMVPVEVCQNGQRMPLVFVDEARVDRVVSMLHLPPSEHN